jgi:hypothetical protein
MTAAKPERTLAFDFGYRHTTRRKLALRPKALQRDREE